MWRTDFLAELGDGPPLQFARGHTRLDIRDGKVVGFVTSGGYAHYSEKSVALGFLPVEMIEEGREVEIEILGEMKKARLISEPLFDPKAERMRG